MKKITKSAFVAIALLVAIAAPTVQSVANTLPTQELIQAEASDWDDILDDYEKMVDDYIKLLKKSQSGDMTALTDSIKMLEKATALSEKLGAAEDELTSQQMIRLAKIAAKLSEAAMSLY